MIRYFNRSVTYMMLAATLLASVPDVRADMDSDYPSDNRIKMLRYDESDIFTIYTLYGYQTNIEFSRGEQVQTISVGDRSLWQIIPSGNRMFIRPMDDEVSTNMTVITNVRTYQFDLKSGKGELKDNPHMVYVARFTYPSKVAQNVETVYVPATQASPITPVLTTPNNGNTLASRPLLTPPPAEPLTSIKQPTAYAPPNEAHYSSYSNNAGAMSARPASGNSALNSAYTYSGADALAPLQVYDDGNTTYFRFADASDFPALRMIASDGMATPVTYTVNDGIAAVRAVAPSIMLTYEKSGQTVYVYNETMQTEGMTHGK